MASNCPGLLRTTMECYGMLWIAKGCAGLLRTATGCRDCKGLLRRLPQELLGIAVDSYVEELLRTVKQY